MNKIIVQFTKNTLVVSLLSGGALVIFVFINYKQSYGLTIIPILITSLFIGLSFALFNNSQYLLEKLSNIHVPKFVRVAFIALSLLLVIWAFGFFTFFVLAQLSYEGIINLPPLGIFILRKLAPLFMKNYPL
jgi:hypothetical protein